MAVNLHETHAKKIESEYRLSSLIMGRLHSQYDFSGAKTVKITTPLTVPYGDYNRGASANRYGTPAEMQDRVQELTISQDKSFSLVIDKGNNLDQQGVKQASKMLRLQINEQGVPMIDKYAFTVLGENAGNAVSGAALTKDSVCDAVSAGTACMDDAEVPAGGRTLFINALCYKNLRLSPEFISVETLGKKSLAMGEVGEYDGMAVVKVPSGRFPSGLQFLIVHRAAACVPHKISDAKLHTDPPGISGNLLEGRDYYDCFIFAPKSAGVYAYFTGRAKTSAPVISAEGALSGSGAGAVYRYTTDGSDPRYSNAAKSGTASGAAKGETVRAYAETSGNLKSDVTSRII